MEKVSSTFKGTWNGLEVKGYRVIGNLKTENNFYEHFDGEIVRMVKGEPTIRDAKGIAIQKLGMGHGVIYKDYIMFIEGTVSQKEFDIKFKEVKKGYEELLNGKVYGFILDYHNFPIIKFILAMFKNNMFSEKTVKDKLKDYLINDGIDVVFSEMLKEKELCNEKVLASA